MSLFCFIFQISGSVGHLWLRSMSAHNSLICNVPLTRTPGNSQTRRPILSCGLTAPFDSDTIHDDIGVRNRQSWNLVQHSRSVFVPWTPYQASNCLQPTLPPGVFSFSLPIPQSFRAEERQPPWWCQFSLPLSFHLPSPITARRFDWYTRTPAYKFSTEFGLRRLSALSVLIPEYIGRTWADISPRLSRLNCLCRVFENSWRRGFTGGRFYPGLWNCWINERFSKLGDGSWCPY